MTTAREQAREAARTEDVRLECEGLTASVEHYANIASDVWEPLLQTLVTHAPFIHWVDFDEVEMMCSEAGCGSWPCAEWNRAQEELG